MSENHVWDFAGPQECNRLQSAMNRLVSSPTQHWKICVDRWEPLYCSIDEPGHILNPLSTLYKDTPIPRISVPMPVSACVCVHVCACACAFVRHFIL